MRSLYQITKRDNTVRSESLFAPRLRYVDLVVSIDARGHQFQHLL
jgi:hypothetical protein